MILVDAHVHFYDCFDLKMFLDSALTNFKAEAARCGKQDGFLGVLLLTESAGENWFQLLDGYAREQSTTLSNAYDNWSFHQTGESCTLEAHYEGTLRLLVISGRQIETAEHLEVLALITDGHFADNIPLQETLEAVGERGAIPVIPWGFGKWTGTRGKILEKALKKANRSDFFLGDNGGRPAFWPRPSHFRLAESMGIRVLSGSDPLPFASECQRPGSFGLVTEGAISPKEPAKDLKKIFLDQEKVFRQYGNLEHPCRFIRNQFAVRIIRSP